MSIGRFATAPGGLLTTMSATAMPTAAAFLLAFAALPVVTGLPPERIMPIVVTAVSVAASTCLILIGAVRSLDSCCDHVKTRVY